MKSRKKPQRMCVACREKKDKFDLVRIVKTPESEVLIETKKRVNGRGAYLCNKIECIEKAKKTNALGNALDIKVPEEIYEDLKRNIKE